MKITIEMKKTKSGMLHEISQHVMGWHQQGIHTDLGHMLPTQWTNAQLDVR